MPTVAIVRFHFKTFARQLKKKYLMVLNTAVDALGFLPLYKDTLQYLKNEQNGETHALII